MSKIQDLLSQINKLNGLNGGNKFVVQITPPASLLNEARTLTFLCDSVTLPGIQLNLEQVRHKGYGLYEQRAVGMQFADVSCTFFVDNKGLSMGFFQKWMQLISSFDPNHERKTVAGLPSEHMNYPENYWGEMSVFMQDKTNANVMTYQITKLYPTNIGSVQLGWDQNDQVLKLPINFTYRSYSTEATERVNTTNNNQLDSLNSLLTSNVNEVAAGNFQ